MKKFFLVFLMGMLFGCSQSNEKANNSQDTEQTISFLNISESVAGFLQYQWSPDGNNIIYSCELEFAGKRICSINADGNGTLELLTPISNLSDRYPQFAPDGEELIFVCGKEDASPSLCLMDMSQPDKSEILVERILASKPLWSPNGDMIAILCSSQLTSGYAICLIDLKNRDSERIFLTSGQAAMITGFDWSPDGESIAYNCAHETEEVICIVDVNEPDNINRFGTGQLNSYPQWSPDGEKIAYLCNAIRVCITDVVGEISVRETAALSDIFAPQWSPDGSKIAYVCANSILEICLLTIDSSEKIIQLTNDQGNMTPKWSPDGKQIAYQCIGEEFNDICIIDVDQQLVDNF